MNAVRGKTGEHTNNGQLLRQTHFGKYVGESINYLARGQTYNNGKEAQETIVELHNPSDIHAWMQ